MIDNIFVHINTYSKFCEVKLSADKDNTTYTIGPNGSEVFTGDPEIKWNSVVFCKETESIWTHGQVFGQKVDEEIQRAITEEGKLQDSIDTLNGDKNINGSIKQVLSNTLGDSGIEGESFEPILGGEFTVTTAQVEGKTYPYAMASVKGRISKHFAYRVTVNGVSYRVPGDLAFFMEEGVKFYEFVGNSKYSHLTGQYFPTKTWDVPFYIPCDLDDNKSIEVYTPTPGTYTILIEKIILSGEKIPNYLIYGDEYAPIKFEALDGSTYSGINIGENKLANKRGTAALGSGNVIKGEFSHAVGVGNVLTSNAFVLGDFNTVTGNGGVAIGHSNNITGTHAFALGNNNEANGTQAMAFGTSNKAGGGRSATFGQITETKGNFSFAEGDHTIASGRDQHVQGAYNIEDTETRTTTPDGTATSGLTKYLHIVGNGSKNKRSNAYTLDWEGNGWFAGDVQAGEHKLSQKLDSNKLKSYTTAEDLVSDINNIPDGAWCAVFGNSTLTTQAQTLSSDDNDDYLL